MTVQDNILFVTLALLCAQSPFSLESTRSITTVFVRSKAKRLKDLHIKDMRLKEAYVELENCAQSDYKYCRRGRKDYHQNTMERPRTFDPTECKHIIRPPKSTDNPQLCF